MAAGNLIDKDEFNRVVGEIARSHERLTLVTTDAKAVLDAKTSAQWATDLGMPEADVIAGMTAVNKSKELADLYTGDATKAVAEDFRVWMRQVRGLSSII